MTLLCRVFSALVVIAFPTMGELDIIWHVFFYIPLLALTFMFAIEIAYNCLDCSSTVCIFIFM